MRLDFIPVFCVFAAASLLFPRSRFSLLIGIVILALTVGSILGWQLAYYGNALPNTYYLKLAGQPLRLMLIRGLWSEGKFLLRGLCPLFATILVLTALQRGDRRLWLLAALVLAFFAYNIRTGGDWIDWITPSRMIAPALPLILIAMVVPGGASSRGSRPSGLSRTVTPNFQFVIVRSSPSWRC